MTAERASEILFMMREFLGNLGVPAPLERSMEAFPVLVSTVISLRTRDAVTRKVSRAVLDAAPDIESMISIDRGKLESLLKPAGFYRQKAGQLKSCAEIIMSQHGGSVPGTMEELLALPGVGRKTANFVMGMVFGEPSICVDVHVHRISNRLGLVSTGTPEETEFALQQLFQREEWTSINHTMVRFGQRICKPARPLCESCFFRDECPSSSTAGE